MAKKKEPEAKKPTIVNKRVRIDLTREEKEAKNEQLLAALSSIDTIEAEFDDVKASYKAKLAEAQANVTTLAITLRQGWEMREAPCVLTFDLAKRKRVYLLAEGPAAGKVVMIDDMTEADLQTELPV